MVLLPEKSRVELGRRSGSPVASGGAERRGRRFGQLVQRAGRGLRRGGPLATPFGDRFVLYQRNIENLCPDQATLREEIRKSVAELFDAALESRAAIAIKGAPEQHAEGANGPGDEDG